MGTCCSAQNSEDVEARQRTQEIDRRLEEDYRRLRKEVKILLLGSGESGKSTVVKQMKILHQHGFNHTELLTNRQVIYRNLIDSAKSLVQYLREFDILPANPENLRETQYISSFTFEGDLNGVPDPEIFRAIDIVWHDKNTPRLFTEHQSEFYLMDSAEYFFENVNRIGGRDYMPTNDDILRARVTTTGIIETRFDMGNLSIHMFDVGGQRSERKKWIHCFEAVTCIIFCVALSEYDQVLLEVNSVNRMEESLTLFGSIVNSAWFTRTSIVLFLNKIDIFRKKLLTVPLEKYYPDYEGGSDAGKAAKYILYRFSQMKQRADMMVYPHLTQATDTSNIRLVFAAVKETILQNALRDAGVL